MSPASTALGSPASPEATAQAPAFRKSADRLQVDAPRGEQADLRQGAVQSLEIGRAADVGGEDLDHLRPASHAVRISVGVNAPGMTSLS